MMGDDRFAIDKVTDWINGIAIDMNQLVRSPSVEDVIFEMSCGMCGENVGDPTFSCESGHVICVACYEKLRRSRQWTCRTEVNSSPEQHFHCGAQINRIDETIKKTPYFKAGMESSLLECKYKEVGCDAVLDEKEIGRHEEEECVFRYLRFCQFKSLCSRGMFKSWGKNLKHLFKFHKSVALIPSSQAHLMVKYDRKEFARDKNKAVVPLIRAGITANDQHYLCLLLVQDLEGNRTRFWLVRAAYKGANNRLSAMICIHPPSGYGEYNYYDVRKMDEVKKISINAHLEVVPEMKQMFQLENPPSQLPYYIDVDNEKLDEKYCIENGGAKYVALMVLIVEYKGEAEDPSKDTFLQNCRKEIEKLEAEYRVMVSYEENQEELDLEEESEREDRKREILSEISDLKLESSMYEFQKYGASGTETHEGIDL